VHPPLYYFYGKLFFDITGESLWVQKILTIIPQVGTLALIATVGPPDCATIQLFCDINFSSKMYKILLSFYMRVKAKARERVENESAIFILSTLP